MKNKEIIKDIQFLRLFIYQCRDLMHDGIDQELIEKCDEILKKIKGE